MDESPKKEMTLREIVIALPENAIDQFVWLLQKNQTYLDYWNSQKQELTRYWYRLNEKSKLYEQYTSYKVFRANTHYFSGGIQPVFLFS